VKAHGLTRWCFFRAFIGGGIAACGAVTATHPFETVKIRYVPLASFAQEPESLAAPAAAKRTREV
jgi:hypothetical protein